MSYTVVLRRPYVGRLLGASLVGRLPAAMAALAIALTLRQAGADYAIVGLVTGTFAVAQAVAGPLLGRCVDRLGQPRVLTVSAIVAAGGYTVLALAPHSTAHALLGAVVAGAATPPLEPCLRALWPRLVEPRELESAYSLDAGAQELLFIAGPLAVTGIAAAGSPRTALWVSAALGLVGALVMSTSKPSRSWTPAARTPHWLGALRSPALLLLIVALCGAGWAVGSFNVFSVAYADSHHVPGGAGTLLALSATGALAGALCYGTYGVRHWRAAPELKATLLASGMAASYWLVALVPGPIGMAVVAVLTGVFFAPLLSVSFGMVGDLAPEGTVTEAFSWLVTLVGAGIAGGSAAGGSLLLHGGPAVAAVAGACGVTAGAALLLAGRRMLTARPAPS
ncbi:MFS transporter [Microtetraspora sp. NBRC 13810]|uniref:MFS transporter n=1 Tax=Microtetraspora sp. NBRC 13810 TaxID=3030990 RepID=UPI0024A2E435|nr:MFS transporter [Microtetraspora sp. NBRC 13810]GLW11694.1 MFS transporter [Microtetraspora sp. NBRC 13810]